MPCATADRRCRLTAHHAPRRTTPSLPRGVCWTRSSAPKSAGRSPTRWRPCPLNSASCWRSRWLASVPEAHRHQLAVPRMYPPSVVPLRGHWHLLERRSWVAWAAAVLLVVLIGGTAVSLSPEVQAQVARLRCVVPGLGVRACDSPGLVSTQAVSAASNGLVVQVLGLQASSDRT